MAIMTVTGNSMADTINPGDQIIIVRHREGDRILQGSVYVWLNAQRGVLVKRAIWQDDGSLLLRPDNDDCPEIYVNDIEAPSWEPIGRVFRVMRAV
jgi:phage repressor protein C with HTH and peptisase S24 domain